MATLWSRPARRATPTRLARSLALAVLAALVVAGCGDVDSVSPDAGSTAPPPFSVSVQVVDEGGSPLAGATVAIGTTSKTVDGEGGVTLEKLTGPTLAVVAAADHLTRPIVIGEEDEGGVLIVELRSRLGGKRWVLHATGDVMFGRRFVAPTSGEPLIPASAPAAGAITVVEHIKDLFGAADVRTINLETTVSNLAPQAAYPAKRFILNAQPETLAAVKALKADLVLLANNHTRDYLEVGLKETLDALDAFQLPYLGASANETDAYAAKTLTVGGIQVGVLCWTSVTGSFVNDSYPSDEVAVPPDLAEAESWQYDKRLWSYSSQSLEVASQPRRIGGAWAVYKEAESGLSTVERAAVWTSLTAVYPEMQDWVARRGHGGAAMWSSTASPAAITALKKTADAVIVQLHSGFQYQEAPSASVKKNARLAIDAGADIVICHHPHVLGGVEWYKDRLIVYSLGNFIFDQDFLASFPSAFVRVIWEGKVPIEAQLIPFEIVDYRPTPVYGKAAERILLRVWESSLIGAETARDPTDNAVKAFTAELDAHTKAPGFALRRNVAVLTSMLPLPQEATLTLAAGETGSLGEAGLVAARLGLDHGETETIEIGRDLFGWGSFEDVLADGEASGDAHWGTAGTRKRVVAGSAASGKWFLQLTRYDSNDGSVLIRPVARVALKTHRIVERQADGAGLPIDPVPTYSLRFKARMNGAGAGAIRYDIYHFDDTNPAEDPDSVLIDSLTQPVDLKSDGEWRQFDMAVPKSSLRSGELNANMVNFYIVLDPPATGSKTVLDVDDIEFVEWRQASAMPQRFGRYELVRNLGPQPVTLRYKVLQAGD